MQPARTAVAVVIALAGLTFIGQGLGILRGSSFMVGDARWALIGIVMVAVAIAIGWSARSPSSG